MQHGRVTQLRPVTSRKQSPCQLACIDHRCNDVSRRAEDILPNVYLLGLCRTFIVLIHIHHLKKKEKKKNQKLCTSNGTCSINGSTIFILFLFFFICLISSIFFFSFFCYFYFWFKLLSLFFFLLFEYLKLTEIQFVCAAYNRYSMEPCIKGAINGHTVQSLRVAER